MAGIVVTPTPERSTKPIAAGHGGTVVEAEYPAANYINASRQLVTDQPVRAAAAGREVVAGDPITKPVCIYLPAGYDVRDRTTRYNTLYLLHGVGGNRREWLDGNRAMDGGFVITNLLDHMIDGGEIAPLIVVFAEGRSSHDWMDTSFNSSATNMLGFYYFDYELRHDLIPFIERTYSPCGAAAEPRTHRALAGLSMGGMQALNLGVGGHRCDAATCVGVPPAWGSGLAATVLAPGMTDLFAYVGAFSSAPTTSEGTVLGRSLASSGHGLSLLYVTCGEADRLLQAGYERSLSGLAEAAGDRLGDCHQVLIRGGTHNFDVWNNGAYNFVRLAFRTLGERDRPTVLRTTIDPR